MIVTVPSLSWTGLLRNLVGMKMARPFTGCVGRDAVEDTQFSALLRSRPWAGLGRTTAPEAER